MKEPSDVLGRMRVASPCGVSWDSMDGDGRVRFCRLCSLNVYDLSEMTRSGIIDVMSSPPPDIEHSGGKTILRGKMLELPIPPK